MSLEAISYPADAHAITRKIEDTSYWYSHRTSIVMSTLKKFVAGKPMVYDLGGGNGIVAKAILNAGYPCTLVEALPQAIEIAKQRGIENTVQKSLQDFNDTGISAIVLLDVLEHIEKEEDILQNIHKQLTKDGTLIITVPAFNHLYSSVDKEIGHFRRYTTQHLESVLKKSGFEITYSSYFFSLLYFPLYLFRVIPEKLFNKKRKGEERRQTEHLANQSILNTLLKYVLNLENILIRNKIKIPFGTSCLVVAKKR